MRAWVDTQVEVGGYGTASEFIRELLREAKQNRAKGELERKLLEGIGSGPRIAVDDKYWTGLKRRVSKRLNKGKTKR